jgi:hypothetical protein
LTGAAGSLARLIRTICDDLDAGAPAYADPHAKGSVEDMLQRLLLLAAPKIIRTCWKRRRPSVQRPIICGESRNISAPMGTNRFRSRTW